MIPALLHTGTEMRRFGRGVLPPIALVTIMCLPLIFGGLFVWSYYDPIGKMDQLPVALVNSDEGAKGPDGKELNAGDQVVDELLKQKPLDFKEVPAQEALDGVVEGDYYFAVEIPTDFSAAATSVTSDNPRSTTLNVAFNNANGFIPTMLGNAATQVMVNTISGVVGTQITDQMLVGFSTIGEGMDAAADGAGRLHEGAGKAEEGAGKLADGSGTLQQNLDKANDGATKLADGAHTLDEGIGTAHDGATKLADGLTRLDAATAMLGDGAGQISGGVNQISGVADQLAGAQDNLAAPLVNAATQLRASGVPGAAQLADQLDAAVADLYAKGLNPELTGQIHRLRDGAAQLAGQLGDPASEYRSGMSQAVSGSQQLAGGLERLKDGSSRLTVGADQLADGTSKLAAGSRQLTVGAGSLRDGLVELDDGSGELALKITDGAGKVPRQEGENREKAAEAGGNPVRRLLTAQDLTPFGVGLAPFFISLALFVGATIMFMVLRPVQQRVLDSGVAPIRAVLASYLPALTVGVGQATLIWIVLEGLIGMDAAHPLGLWVSMCCVSAVFVAVTQAINAVVGATAGRVICLMFMALQLVSSGGLYPPETQPKFIQHVHSWDPMRFTVDIFREVIIGTDVPGSTATNPRPVQAVFALLLVLAIAWTLSSISAWRGRIIMHKDLHPELTV
ncbi:YhgE/Pip domain-containing protein [Corynebacterium sp. MSK006]|uniref:YhgE/Pip domain-containing protein n=1 Tax=Corynebacterium sp. MSK006 TaxID=3050187 RepID=UPI00254E42F3|nr:YhgE/Pip domain-containing protein [Corynebacterium sp. MSK006]MDK8894758.1 YhgE/Pip domain-containing protein [Corynebacterium sp. MSK006]